MMLVYKYPDSYYRELSDIDDSKEQTVKNCEELLEYPLPVGVAERLEDLIRDKRG